MSRAEMALAWQGCAVRRTSGICHECRCSQKTSPELMVGEHTANKVEWFDGRRAQARAQDHGRDSGSAEAGTVPGRPKGAGYDLRHSRRRHMGQADPWRLTIAGRHLKQGHERQRDPATGAPWIASRKRHFVTSLLDVRTRFHLPAYSLTIPALAQGNGKLHRVTNGPCGGFPIALLCA
jgi:hypothetical protein